MNHSVAIGGALRPDCPWYVIRKADEEVFERVLAGRSSYILTSHQMGKSSLNARLLNRLRTVGTPAVVVDLASIGVTLSESQWYHAMALRIGRQINLEDELDRFLKSAHQLRGCELLIGALDQIVLPACDGGLVILLDESDLMRSLPFQIDGFVRELQRCFDLNDAGGLTVCIFATVMPKKLVGRSSQIQLDVSDVISLDDFTHDEWRAVMPQVVEFYVGKSQQPVTTSREDLSLLFVRFLERVYYWTHGHPYLSHKLACVSIRRLLEGPQRAQPLDAEILVNTVDKVCRQLFLRPLAKDPDENLACIARLLTTVSHRSSDFLEAYARLLAGAEILVDEDWQASETLVELGLVRIEQRRLVVRNRIYQHTFSRRWISDLIWDDGSRPRRNRQVLTPLNVDVRVALHPVSPLNPAAGKFLSFEPT